MKRPYVFAILISALGILGSTQPQAQSGGTIVSIQGTQFLINGVVTHRGTAAEGLLLNSRMVQAAFDDENSSTVGNWKYPDTGRWDPDRNTDEFIAALPSYRAKGMRAFTVNLQGGATGLYRGNDQPPITSAFRSDGMLKSAWTNRLDRVIRGADANGLVVIVGFFYFGQDHRLADEAAVIRAVDSATDWLVGSGYRNVLVEINNEADGAYGHQILLPKRVHELISRVKQRSGGALKVSASLRGGAIPPDAMITASDYVLLHGNGMTPSQIAGMVSQVRSLTSYKAKPKPIVFNEDGHFFDNMDAAVKAGASWGFYNQGQSNYVDGFQSPPVNWTINTDKKREFFDRVAHWTNTGPSDPPPPSTQSVTSFTLINSLTGQPVAGYNPLSNGATLNLATLPSRSLTLVANTSPSVVGSVRFGVDGNSNYRTENASPYSLAGEGGVDWLSPGSHTVTATPYSSANAGGTAGTARTVQFTIIDDADLPCAYTLSPTSSTLGAAGGAGNVNVSTGSTCAWKATSNANWLTITATQSATGSATVKYSATAHSGSSPRTGTLTIAGQTFTVTQTAASSSTQAVVSFTLINADTNQPIAGYDPLPDGAVLNLSTLPTRNLALRANTSPSIVGSVRFAVDGNSNYRIESDAPYAMSGDTNGNFNPWTLSPGAHTVTATPYSGAGGGGTPGTSLTRQFTIVDDGSVPPKPPSNVRIIK